MRKERLCPDCLWPITGQAERCVSCASREKWRRPDYRARRDEGLRRSWARRIGGRDGQE
jgi:hypothetical protein